MFGYTTLRDKAQKQVPDPQWIFKRQTCDHPNDCRRLFLSWCERVMCWDVLSHSHISDVNYFFIITYHLHVRIHSRMRSKGSRFTLGVWGLRVCSLDVAFASATVRNRSREDRMAVPMGSFTEVVLFGGFRRLVASFRVAGVALRDIQTCSATCRKSFRVAGAILLRRFQKMCCSFRGRRSTLDASIVIFRGRRSTLDASCGVFL